MKTRKSKVNRTFIVKLNAPKDGNWSGNVSIADTGKVKQFKGTLELLRTIDNEVEDLEQDK